MRHALSLLVLLAACSATNDYWLVDTEADPDEAADHQESTRMPWDPLEPSDGVGAQPDTSDAEEPGDASPPDQVTEPPEHDDTNEPADTDTPSVEDTDAAVDTDRDTDAPAEAADDWIDERFAPHDTHVLDVLWVIDNSCSMGDEQAAIAANAPAFMDAFRGSDLDWHVGVITTDTEASQQSGKLQAHRGTRFIDPSTPQPVETFAAMATVGTVGSAHERGLRAVWMALDDEAAKIHNTGFFRAEAGLAIIVVSDEDDTSEPMPTVEQFIDRLRAEKPDRGAVMFANVTTPDPQGPCGGPDARPGVAYHRVSDAFVGPSVSICSPHWARSLATLRTTAEGLTQILRLADTPDLATLDVRVVLADGTVWAGLRDDQDPLDCPTDRCIRWSWDEALRAIRLAERPPATAVVHVSYAPAP